MSKWILRTIPTVLLCVCVLQKAHASTRIFIDALIWQMKESNAANWGQELTPSAPNETITFFTVPFNYTSGIRIGAAFDNENTPWHADVYYTQYHTEAKNQVQTNTAELHPAFSGNFYANNPAGNGISGPYYHAAAIQWHLKFNTLDAALSQSTNIDNRVMLRPFIGLKAARIYQTINSQWQQPYEPTDAANPDPVPINTFSSATETITNNFKGLGPSIGVHAAWHLFENAQHGLNLIADASSALLWGRWSFSDKYYNDTPQTITTCSDPLSSSALMVQGFLGFEWNGLINTTDWSIRLGYEAQAWFNQLQYYSFDMGKTNDTLYLQGAVVGFNIHF